jgi:hypothetical protein
VVESTGFENQQGRKLLVGSNPTLSAKRNFPFGQSRAASRRGRGGVQKMPPLRGELARRGEFKMRGFALVSNPK